MPSFLKEFPLWLLLEAQPSPVLTGSAFLVLVLILVVVLQITDELGKLKKLGLPVKKEPSPDVGEELDEGKN